MENAVVAFDDRRNPTLESKKDTEQEYIDPDFIVVDDFDEVKEDLLSIQHLFSAIP